MSEIRQRIASLSPKKRTELERRLLANVSAPYFPTIPRREVASPCPLSFAQQRLWFLDQFEPGSVTYNVRRIWRLKGPLNAEALHRALNTIVTRHEVFRTNLRSADGKPEQVICPERVLDLPVTDLSGKPPAEREAEARRLAREECQLPFDLSRDLLLRARLLRLDADDHVLVLTQHHIASDAWSEWVLRRELAALYDAFSKGLASPLAELPIQYADYAVWQRNWMKGEVLESQLAYWRAQLRGIPPVLHLPADHPRPAVQTHRGATESIVLPEQLTADLKGLSQREGATVFMTLLAAFQTLLSRYTGQEDIVVGSPIANRNHVELEGLIGFFVNTLALRTDLSGDPTFRELMHRVRRVALDSYAHAEIPFEKLVEELQPQRNLSHTPLFQVVLAFQNAPATDLQLAGLKVSPWNVAVGTSKFDLTADVTEVAGRLEVVFEYNTDLFEAATIRRMLEHFQVLLEGVAANPNERISSLPVLTRAERRQLLVEWNDRRAARVEDRCVHESFESQALRNPDAVAVVYKDQRLSYGDLNRRANQLAHHLRSVGVGPETLVGLCLERSPTMVLGILGILKAGGAYVPLDPDDPPERLALILEDSRAPVLVTERRLAETLPPHDSRTVLIDGDWDTISRGPEQPPASAVGMGNAAYVIYTSGSTGKPKGVIVTHGNLARLFSATQDDYGFGENDVWTLFHSCAFDFSVWEMWGALIYGGRLVVVSRTVARSPDAFLQLLSREGVTVLNQTPSAFQQLIRAERKPAEDLRLRLIIFGGEVLDFRTLEPWIQRHGDRPARLVNMYGITETTVFVTRYQVLEKDLHADRGSIIGRPIPDWRVYILDKYRNPAPIGVRGEMYVGGAGVARGYLNRPAMNEEKFVRDPFVQEPEARLYRTGDLACYLPDGNIEFLGRIDDQVKIRGFRIEPGEIETVLRGHPAVLDAAVAAREDEPGNRRLVAYLVPKDGPAPVLTELRRFLRSKLPEYMLPSAFMLLKSMPLLPSGKVDRRALPTPDKSRPELEERFVAPRNPLEQRMARVWADVLGLESVGVRDGFFDLGGHSLLAVVLFTRIEKEFGRRLPISALFQAPTVEELTRVLCGDMELPRWSALVPMQPNGTRPPLFCVHGADGHVLMYRDLARRLGPDQPFYGLQAIGMDGVEPPLTRVDEMAARYIEEMRTVQPQGPYFVGGLCLGAFVALEIALQLQAQGQQVALLACINTDAGWREVTSFRQGFAYHWHHLSKLGLGGRTTYILNRLRYRIRRGKNTVVELISYVYRKMERPMPVKLLHIHVEELSHRAGEKYVPRLYNGKVTCFQGSADSYRDPRLFWRRVASDGVVVRTVPGGDVDVLREPNVRVLAESLRACMDGLGEEASGAP